MGARAGFRRFLGISLGGGRGKTTAVCALVIDGGSRAHLQQARVRGDHRGGGHGRDEGGAYHDAALLAWIERHGGSDALLAIDAPLTLPPCLRCELVCPGADACTVPQVAWMREHAAALRRPSRSGRSADKPLVTPYTQRACELLLESATLQPRESLGQSTGPHAARASFLRRALAPRYRLHENLLEVHPRATLLLEFGEPAERQTRHGETSATWRARLRILDDLLAGVELDGVWPELVARNVHLFHAVVCAVAGLRWAREGWPGPSVLVEGDADGPLAAAVEALALGWIDWGWTWVGPRRAVRRSAGGPAGGGPADRGGAG